MPLVYVPLSDDEKARIIRDEYFLIGIWKDLEAIPAHRGLLSDYVERRLRGEAVSNEEARRVFEAVLNTASITEEPEPQRAGSAQRAIRLLDESTSLLKYLCQKLAARPPITPGQNQAGLDRYPGMVRSDVYQIMEAHNYTSPDHSVTYDQLYKTALFISTHYLGETQSWRVEGSFNSRTNEMEGMFSVRNGQQVVRHLSGDTLGDITEQARALQAKGLTGAEILPTHGASPPLHTPATNSGEVAPHGEELHPGTAKLPQGRPSSTPPRQPFRPRGK